MDPERVDLVSLRVCQVIVPVTLCSLYVAVLVRVLAWGEDGDNNLIQNAWQHTGLLSSEQTFSANLLNNMIIVSIFVLLIVLVTLLMLFVFYMGWHACLQYYFYLPSLVIMVFITPAYIRRIMAALNWFAIDVPTLVLFVWNFSMLGLISIFKFYAKTSLYVQQFYLIHNSAMLAVFILECLPGWAAWLLQGFLVLWDLFAVLAPFGPLNLIINMAEKGGVVEMPGVVYQTDLVPENDERDGNSRRKNYRNLNGRTKTIDSNEKSNEADSDKDTATKTEGQQEGEAQLEPADSRSSDGTLDFTERGVNIGLGDFIFYGLLIGLTCKGRRLQDYYAFLSTLNAILLGLVITITILAATKRALPALPVSIALGLMAAVGSMFFAAPLANRLAEEQVFI